MGKDTLKIGERIRQERKAQGLTQKQLGEKLGITQQAIEQIESSKSINMSTLKKVAFSLGISPELLVRDAPKEGPMKKVNVYLMKKLVTDNPKGNVESAHNLFYIKNKETWVLGGGPAPDYADISLYDFMRRIISIHGLNIQTDDNDAMGEQLYDLLLDNVDSKEGVAALLYAAAWAFSELREKLKAYENTELEPEEIEALKVELQKEKNK